MKTKTLKTKTGRTVVTSAALALLLALSGIAVLVGSRSAGEAARESRTATALQPDAEASSSSPARNAHRNSAPATPVVEADAAPDEAEPRDVSIHGRVADAAGAAVADALVVAVDMEKWTALADASQRTMMRGMQDPRHAVAELRKRCDSRFGDMPRTRSRDDGSFVFEGLDSGVYRLFVIHKSSLPSDDTWVSVEPGHPADVDVELVAGHSIAGRVVDEKGRPVRDATVRVTPSHQPRRGVGKLTASFLDLADASFTARSRVSRTRTDGTFELRSLEPIAYDLDVRAARFSKAMVTDVYAGAGDEVHVRLAQGASLTARVVDRREQAIGGAVWKLRPVDSVDPRDPTAMMTMAVDLFDDATQRGTTDAEGKLRATGLEPGSYEIALAVEGSAPVNYKVKVEPGTAELGNLLFEESPAPAEENETPDPRDDVEQPSRLVHGIVVDPDGGPVRHARVRFEVPGVPHLVARSVGTRRDGSFELEVPASPAGALPPRMKIVATQRGFAPGRLAASSIPDGGDPVQIALLRGATVNGRVVDASGNAVAGAQVRIIESSGFNGAPDPGQDLEALKRRRNAMVDYSDTGGEYGFRGVGAGEYTIEAESVALSASVTGIHVESDDVTLDVVLDLVLEEVQPASTVDADADADAEVGALRVKVVSAATTLPISGFHIGVDGDSRQVDDRDGAVTIDGLAAGRHRVAVSAPGYQYAERDVDVSKGSESEIEVALRPGLRVHFLVVTPEGDAVDGARVNCIRGPQESVQDPDTLVTGLDGRVTVTGLSERTYSFSVGHSFFVLSEGQRLSATLPRDAGGEIVVVMEAAGQVVGEVTLHEDRPEAIQHLLQLIPVTSIFNGIHGPVVVDSASGEFRFDGVRPGTYRVVMTRYAADPQFELEVDDDGNPVPATLGTVEVVAGDLTHIELEAPMTRN